MDKKRGWEKEYEKYSSSTELETRISELNEKYENQTMTREELKEWEHKKSLKQNLPKVKHILELRDKLSNDIKAIEEELNARKNLVKINEESEKLENELIALEAIRNDLAEKLKNKDLSEEERSSLNEQYSQNEQRINQNNIIYGQAQEKLAKSSEIIKNPEVSNEDLEKQSQKAYTQRSTCNYACNKLMQGFSWNSVETALDNFKDRKFTANKEQSEKMHNIKEALGKGAESKGKEGPGLTEPVTEEGEKSLVTTPEKTSFMNKVKGFFKKVANKVKSTFGKKKDEELEGEQTEGTTVEPPKEDDFRKYLREVAEKGITGIEEENKQQAATTELEKKIELYEKRYKELLGREDADKTTIEKLASQIEELKAQRDGKDEGR